MRLAFLSLPGLAAAVAVAASTTSCGGDVESTRYVLRVDHTVANAPASVRTPTDPIPDASYTPCEPQDRYEIVLDGDHVTISPISPIGGSQSAIEGTLEASPAGTDEKRFRLETTFAGGAFVIRGVRGELTLYGSGVPIVSSERGDLVTR